MLLRTALIGRCNCQTTNENWLPCLLDESVKVIYKMIDLQCLAVYWNPDIKTFLSGSFHNNLFSKCMCYFFYCMRHDLVWNGRYLGYLKDCWQVKAMCCVFLWLIEQFIQRYQSKIAQWIKWLNFFEKHKQFSYQVCLFYILLLLFILLIFWDTGIINIVFCRFNSKTSDSFLYFIVLQTRIEINSWVILKTQSVLQIKFPPVSITVSNWVFVVKFENSFLPKNMQIMPLFSVIKPITLQVRFRLNPHPENDLSTPKIVLSVSLQSIGLRMLHVQYHGVMELVESMDRMVVNAPFRKFKPNVPISKDPRKW